MRLVAREFLLAALRYITPEFLAAVRAERIVRKTQRHLEESDDFSGDDAHVITVDRHAENEKSRRRTVEEKARGNLVALAVCTSLIFAGLSFMSSQGATALIRGKARFMVLLVLAVTYFALAAISAVRALEIGESYGTTIEDEKLAPEELGRMKMRHFELNKLTTNMKANWTSVSFSYLRNAIICLLIFAVLVALRLSSL